LSSSDGGPDNKDEEVVVEDGSVMLTIGGEGRGLLEVEVGVVEERML
jgi:hypothetical protein